MKTTDVSRQAAATLATVNAVLDGDVVHWTDPEFLEWERGQVDDDTISWDTDDGLTRTVYAPGPAHWLTGNDAGVEADDTVRVSPMVDHFGDHPWCACETDPGTPTLRRWMLMSAADYPPPEHTTHGPLMLGPEPETVSQVCDACTGSGQALEGAECGGCGGDGRQHPEVAW